MTMLYFPLENFKGIYNQEEEKEKELYMYTHV